MSKTPVSVKNKILAGVKKGVKKRVLCYLRVSKNVFDRQGVKMGVKKHVSRYLTGVKKGVKKHYINISIFFDTLPSRAGQCDVSCAFTFAQRHLTRYALTKGK